MEKLKKFRPLIAVFNGKCKRCSSAPLVGLDPTVGPVPGHHHFAQTDTDLFLGTSGIYEMFCRELFGKKPKTLEFGLQPHKIPDCDVVSGTPFWLSVV